MEAFILATRRGDDARAAHLLDLSDIPAADQKASGPALAGKLGALIERKVWLDWEGLPDRPDGMDTRGSSKEAMVGEPRKSLRVATLDLPQWPVAIRLNRVAGGDEAPVWVFSPQTVEHIDALYAKYGPTWLERQLPSVLRGEAFLKLEWWELIAAPLVLMGAVAAGYLLWRIFGRVAQRIAHEPAREALSSAKLPLALFLVGIGLRSVTTNWFVFSRPVEALIDPLFVLLILIALVVAVSRAFDTFIDFASNRFVDTIDDPANTDARRLYTNLSAAKRVGVIIVVVVGAAMAISSLDVFQSFGMSLLVSAGLATAILGIAAQTLLGNVLSSLQIAFAKPIRIGDAIYYEGHWSYVEAIRYTYVQLRTWDQKRFVVPVKHLVSTPFENWTKGDPQLIMPVLLKLDHGVDVEDLRCTFKAFAKDDPDWSEDAEPLVQVVDHDEDGMDVRFYCTADNPTAAWNLHCRMRERLLAHLREFKEPRGLPRQRVALVQNLSDGNETSQPSGDLDRINEDTGEPEFERHAAE